MDIASLKLCKELYALSGWKEVSYWWTWEKFDEVSGMHQLVDDRAAPFTTSTYPAYDLGCLLRKLPQNSWVGYTDTSGRRGYALAHTYAWNKAGSDVGKIAECQADTPEDAACLLAIELFKQGVLRADD